MHAQGNIDRNIIMRPVKLNQVKDYRMGKEFNTRHKRHLRISEEEDFDIRLCQANQNGTICPRVLIRDLLNSLIKLPCNGCQCVIQGSQREMLKSFVGSWVLVISMFIWILINASNIELILYHESSTGQSHTNVQVNTICEYDFRIHTYFFDNFSDCFYKGDE